MRVYPIDPRTRELWKSIPIRFVGPARSPCHGEPTLLVQSMESGFVTPNCVECGKPASLSEQEFRNLDLWVACPECRGRMEPGLAEGVYGYVCKPCEVRVELASVLPTHLMGDRPSRGRKVAPTGGAECQTSQTFEISGCRIRLRDWTLEDLPAYKHWLQPDQEWHRHDGPWWGPPRVETIEAEIEQMRGEILGADWPVPRKGVVIADLATDRFIGTTGWSWKLKEANSRDVGIGIYDPRNRGKGLGFEALGLLTEHLFDALPEIVRLGVGTWSGNVRMVGLAKKLGYLEEACVRRGVIVEGEYYDSVGYGILREEWKDRYPNGFAADALGLAGCE